MSFPLCVKPSNALSKCLKIWCSGNIEFTQKPSNKGKIIGQPHSWAHRYPKQNTG